MGTWWPGVNWGSEWLITLSGVGVVPWHFLRKNYEDRVTSPAPGGFSCKRLSGTQTSPVVGSRDRNSCVLHG